MQFMKVTDIGRITDYNQEADKEIEGIREIAAVSQLTDGLISLEPQCRRRDETLC
jgi:hypothetical protein